MKNIVLVFPRARESVWNMRLALDVLGKRAFIPPLGLATLAALTPPRYRVTLVDEAIAPVDFSMPCDLVGVAGYTFNAARMLEISRSFRKKGVLAVAGGPYCTTDTETCRREFDVVFAGEAERTWPRFLEEWEQGRHAPLYEEREFVDMAASPPPRWDLVDLSQYTSGIVQTTRGCMYDCEFCDVVALNGRAVRTKAVEAAEEEVRELMRRGISTIWIADDNFTADIAHAKRLLSRLAAVNRSARRRARFITQITADRTADAELLSLLKAANVYAALIGIESANRESLIETGKWQNVRTSLAEAVRKVQAQGIYVVGGMIVGFDADDRNVFSAQERFIAETGLLLPVISMLKASKGTRLWKRLSAEGRLTDGDDGDFYSACNFTPRNMTREELETGYRHLLETVFGYPHSLERFKKFVEQSAAAGGATEGEALSLKDIASGLRVTRHFLFRAGHEARRFFLKGLYAGSRNGMRGVAAFAETAVWLESHRACLLKGRTSLRRGQ
jgi:radical SAM superfamily enzyme YgiQ (UPF0313 family)